MIITSALAVILAILAILDVVSTRRAMSRPGNVESNPVMAWLMRHGNLWIAVKIAATGLALRMSLDDHPLPLAALCVVYAIVVYRNFKLAR